MDAKEKQIPAEHLKQRFLSVIDQVASTRRPVVITRGGKPVARLVPLETAAEIERRILARLRKGKGGMLVDEKTFLEPSSHLIGRPQT